MMKQDKGFTLVELLVALTILAMGLFALTQMGVTSINSNRGSSEETIATRLAQNKIDELKKEMYTSLAIQANVLDAQNPLNSQGINGGTYVRSWSIANGPTTGTKKVTVRVTWANGSKSVVLSTLVGDEGYE